ncbi:hypothetical protein [Cupriavidus pauculus]|nr:hypothetical protein [Cupriavidus pauculus]
MQPPHFHGTPKIDLRTLVLGLTLTASVVTLANCLYAAYQIER